MPGSKELAFLSGERGRGDILHGATCLQLVHVNAWFKRAGFQYEQIWISLLLWGIWQNHFSTKFQVYICMQRRFFGACPKLELFLISSSLANSSCSTLSQFLQIDKSISSDVSPRIETWYVFSYNHIPPTKLAGKCFLNVNSLANSCFMTS